MTGIPHSAPLRGVLGVGALVVLLWLPAAVLALEGSGVSAGGILDANPPEVTITYPTGGESLTGGGGAILTWAIDEYFPELMSTFITMSIYDGPTEIFSDFVAPDLSGNYSYSWAVPDIYTTNATMVVEAEDHFGWPGGATSGAFTIVNSLSGIDGDRLPLVNRLEPNYPNPFNPSTSFQFALKAPAAIELAIYDLGGRQIAVLATGDWTAGTHSVVWNGKDLSGQNASSGVYLARLRIDGENPETMVQRVTLLK